MTKTIFKVGDKIRMIGNCSGAKHGEVYTLRDTDGYLETELEDNLSGCSCQNKWELITEDDKQYKEGALLFTTEIGNVIYRRVLGVAGKAVFITSTFQKHEKEPEVCMSSAYHIEELKKDGWVVTSEIAPDEPEVEVEMVEILGKKYPKAEIEKVLEAFSS